MKIITNLLLAAFALSSPAFAETTLLVTHGKTPDPTYIDLGAPGASVGDERIWQFGGQSSENEKVIMDWVMTTTGNAVGQTGLESRITLGIFVFGDDMKNRILIQGIGLYPVAGSTLKIDMTLERAIIGGTGRYAGISGSVTSTQLEDGNWKHIFHIKD